MLSVSGCGGLGLGRGGGLMGIWWLIWRGKFVGMDSFLSGRIVCFVRTVTY